MNLNDFNLSSKELKQNKSSESKQDFLTNLITDLQKVISDFLKNPSQFKSNNISENSICVVRDINDKKLSLINIEDGQEFDIYVVSSNKDIQILNDKGISNNIYRISEEDLYNMNLGSNIIIKNNSCILYNEKITIENSKAAAKLEDMYFCLEQEKNAIYSVCEISDEKIYLTNTTEGGYFSIPRAEYPNFKIGNLVKIVNGKYTLV